MNHTKAATLLNDLIDRVPLSAVERQQGKLYVQMLEQAARTADEFSEKLEQAKKEHNEKINELRRKIDAR